MFENFRPFGTSDEEWETMKVLQDGVPVHLKEGLIEWLINGLTVESEYTGARWMESAVAHTIYSVLRIDLGARASSSIGASQLVDTLRAMSDIQLLRLTDFVAASDDQFRHPQVDGLNAILAMAGSKWCAEWDGENWRLQARVPEGVQDAVEAAMDARTSAAKLLKRAWTAAYGLSPNPGEAYRLAVKAVETCACPLIEPANKGATLGTTISALSNQPTWTLPLRQRDDEPTANRDAILGLMRILYRGQSDRHADGELAIAQAHTAIYAAATLVAWFDAGYVTKP
jgi:hypothetical protein